jgi:hypothetical protein
VRIPTWIIAIVVGFAIQSLLILAHA